MSEFKYVVVTSSEGEQMFLFPKNVNHDEFSEVLSYIKEPISAGFTDLKTCYGRSESLDLDSRKEDTELLLKGGK